MSISVLVNGAEGRMGQQAVGAVEQERGLELVGRTDMDDDLAGAIAENSAQVVENELQQRAGMQRLEWDLREQELQDKYDAWERKMAAIFARGKKQWGGALNNFVQRWRNWEQDFDDKVAEKNKLWDEKVAEHFKKKQDWETEIRTKYQASTMKDQMSTIIDNLNSQIGK